MIRLKSLLTGLAIHTISFVLLAVLPDPPEFIDPQNSLRQTLGVVIRETVREKKEFDNQKIGDDQFLSAVFKKKFEEEKWESKLDKRFVDTWEEALRILLVY